MRILWSLSCFSGPQRTPRSDSPKLTPLGEQPELRPHSTTHVRHGQVDGRLIVGRYVGRPVARLDRCQSTGEKNCQSQTFLDFLQHRELIFDSLRPPVVIRSFERLWPLAGFFYQAPYALRVSRTALVLRTMLTANLIGLTKVGAPPEVREYAVCCVESLSESIKGLQPRIPSSIPRRCPPQLP